MSANDRQVGGDHYRKHGATGEQHWDRIARLYGPASFPYFAGQITAYVERYRDKNGVQDLEKARHFLDKLIELEKGWAADAETEVEHERDGGFRWKHPGTAEALDHLFSQEEKAGPTVLSVDPDPRLGTDLGGLVGSVHTVPVTLLGGPPEQVTDLTAGRGLDPKPPPLHRPASPGEHIVDLSCDKYRSDAHPDQR
jgi:hypothetical protein